MVPGIAKYDESERIRGVFSRKSTIKTGFGATSQKRIQKAYYLVEEDEDGAFSAQALNQANMPAGVKRSLTHEEILKDYSPEPQIYHQIAPKLKELDQTLDTADEHREEGRDYSAKFEYGVALKIDEENIRATFGIGLVHLKRHETDKADAIFQKLIAMDAAFEKEHKHLFNDFGISMRKNEMYVQSMEFYQRAEELAQDDENLYYNMARTSFEMGDLGSCREYLERSLAINPVMQESANFLDFLRREGMI